LWPIASIRTHTLNGRYRRHSGLCSALARNDSVANDPKRAPVRLDSVLRCGSKRQITLHCAICQAHRKSCDVSRLLVVFPGVERTALIGRLLAAIVARNDAVVPPGVAPAATIKGGQLPVQAVPGRLANGTCRRHRATNCCRTACENRDGEPNGGAWIIGRDPCHPQADDQILLLIYAWPLPNGYCSC
jgi:hypothetical protein